MHVVFRLDSSPRIGGGHALRCLAIANRLRQHGAIATFVSARVLPLVRDQIEIGGHELIEIDAADSVDSGEDWDVQVWSDREQTADATRTIRAVGGKHFSWAVCDHYNLSRAWQQQVRGIAERVMVIDDMANRPHDCDLLLDQNLGRNAEDYASLLPAGCKLLLGPMFAPLRDEFAQLRDEALARRAGAAPVRRLLIGLGSTDVGGVSGTVLAELLQSGIDCAMDVVLAPGAPSLAEVRHLAAGRQGVRVHIEPPSMARLMVETDLAVGAAGTSSWERCCMALPSVVLILAENQRFIAEQLEQAGAHRISTVGGSSLAPQVADLVMDAAARTSMAAAAAAICDGGGADRVCAEMLVPGKGATGG